VRERGIAASGENPFHPLQEWPNFAVDSPPPFKEALGDNLVNMSWSCEATLLRFYPEIHLAREQLAGKRKERRQSRRPAGFFPFGGEMTFAVNT